MSRSLRVRRPNAEEVRQAGQLLCTSERAQQRRRADIIILLAAGLSAADIARALSVHINTVYGDLHAFESVGIAALKHPQQRGAPRRLGSDTEAEIQALADRAPYELGLPYGRWSLSKLRSYLLKHRIVTAISREHLRQVLKKGGSCCVVSSASSRALIRNARRSSAVCA